MNIQSEVTNNFRQSEVEGSGWNVRQGIKIMMAIGKCCFRVSQFCSSIKYMQHHAAEEPVKANIQVIVIKKITILVGTATTASTNE